MGSNSSRANSPFFSMNSALDQVRTGLGSVHPARGEDKHQENFFTADFALHQKKDWIRLRAFPQSSIKSSQPEAAELLHLPVSVAVTTSLKSFEQLFLKEKTVSGPRLPGRIRHGPNSSFVQAARGLRQRKSHDMGHLTLAWKSWDEQAQVHRFLCSEAKLELFTANAGLKAVRSWVGRNVLGEMATEQTCYSYPMQGGGWSSSVLLSMVNPQPQPCLQKIINPTFKLKQPLNEQVVPLPLKDRMAKSLKWTKCY